jgi:hypothetical protein
MFKEVILEQNRNNAKRRLLLKRPLAGRIQSDRKDWPVAVFTLAHAMERSAVSNALIKLSLAAAGLAAALSLTASAANAAGWRHEPWCAVFEYDDVTWDCSYHTFAECYPNVIGGIRGSCNPNPDGPTGQTAASTTVRKHTKQQVQQ